MSPPVGVITGGVSGIGAATAVEFARLGARLVLLDISAAGGEEIEDRVRAAGGQATTISCDVSDAEAVEAAIGSAAAELGGLDFIVANAGIAEQSLIATGDPKRWATVVSTNLLGAMNSIRAALPVMRRQGHGHVLIVASVSGREAYVGRARLHRQQMGPGRVRARAPDGGGRVRRSCHRRRAGERGHPADHGQPHDPAADGHDRALAPEDVARCLVFAYQQPARAVISELVIRPLNEPTNDLPGFADADA